METRSEDVLYTLGDIKFKRRDSLDLSKAQQLPTYRYLLERYLTMMKAKPRNLKEKKEIVIHELSEEIRGTWIFMNIPPITTVALKKKMKKLIEIFDKLRFTADAKRKDTWYNELKSIESNLDNGYDIKTDDENITQLVIEKYGVIPGEEEELLHHDSCVPDKTTNTSSRLRWCVEVDKEWWSGAIKRWKMIAKQERCARDRTKKIHDERVKLEEMKRVEGECTLLGSKLDASMSSFDEEVPFHEEDDSPYMPLKISNQESKVVRNTVDNRASTPASNTRKKRAEVDSISDTNEATFPKIRVRTGYKTFNVDVMESLVVLESVFKVEGRKAPHLLVYIANKVFKQEWSVLEESESKIQEESENIELAPRKRRRSIGYLDYVLPHRSAIAKMVESYSLLSFADMAESIDKAKDEHKVVTYGADDTVKAAGNKLFDVKATHVTIIDPDKQRETFTSGFYLNPSHSGLDASKTVKHDIAKMAVLTNNTYDDMKNMLDFFMNDRAGDGDVMLDHLDVEQGKRLKCNAHILLAVDVALDKVYKDAETLMGVSNLISTAASHCFNAPKNSTWYLGLIAIAKLLSPSRGKESVSLYDDYTKFLKHEMEAGGSTQDLCQNILKNGFKGFRSNRFGRIGELSTAVIQHITLIDKFFDEVVDENANKLVLAVHAYKQSEWFKLCCEVSAFFFKTVTIPIKELIGIDEFKNKKVENRTWSGIKNE